MLCLYDQTEHVDLSAMLAHLKSCGVPQKTYFTDFAPRFDKMTGEKIPYKAPAERYLKIDFAHKNNLKKFLKVHPEEGKKWAIEWLAARKAEKNLVYAPSQAELRSLMCPTVLYYDSIGGYNEICAKLGYKIRYDGAIPPATDLGCPIIIDTREQQPLELKGQIVSAKLNCGDYGLPPSHDKGIYLERKSLQDFVGTLSERASKNGDSNLERFTRELERAAETGGYIVMLVEKSINDAMAFNKIGYVPLSYCKVQPDHIFKNLRDLLVRFPLNFQVLFVKGRLEAKVAVPRILSMGEAVKKIDLQAAYEKGDLTFE